MSAGRVPPALSLAWIEQAGRALDAAHTAGVVHRDVKPANLMLGSEGDVRVTDFGIARIAGDVSLTSVGTILGTSGYMSPEQAVGGTATTASDRYGLAVVAFELLCGRRPYLADSFASEAAAHATAPIPAPTRFDASLPPSIDLVFERGLAKDPAQRFRSCGELVSALRASFAESAGTTVRILPPSAGAATVTRTRRRFPRALVVLAALGALALLGLLAAGLANRGGEAAPPTTVVRTATVAGKSVVRTVTVEAQKPTPPTNPPASTPAPTQAGTSLATPAGTDGAALNDQGLRLLKAGNATAARPLLERAVTALQGSGSVTEAYALYNLALARFSTGDCTGVKDMLHQSERIQGKRDEIKQLEHDVDRACKR